MVQGKKVTIMGAVLLANGLVALVLLITAV